ncbi:uncharacterized protein DEA37_0008540 [Paragonimus westermani]|uniref:INTS8 TPR repeats domain-containing protein n=1 Tax=Paragonimus westermani TaxID=34504 RepID=A0A5J4NZF3_9TREM|nr:uncharacterized protein DEA37_0008540 [Paragonimus westermani]
MDVDRSWLYYLVRPTQLLLEIDTLTVAQKLALLKQFLSQAEITDRKSLTNTVNRNDGPNELDSNTQKSTSDSQMFGLEIDSSSVYRKSKILNALALQLAAVFKFNLNLFSVTYEFPVRLLARLYRVLVNVTAKSSPILQPLFDQAVDKENIFIINPYTRFTWHTLYPTTIYAVMSYHIWCLQVSLLSSMLPQPFRNLTPVVAGLSEVPDTAFFNDNRVEVGVILDRVEESVSQLTSILKQLDGLRICRPFPAAFPLVGPGLPPALGAPAYVKSDEAEEDGISSRDEEVLPKPYVTLSLNFVLGRHAFQKQLFEQAEEQLDSCLSLLLTNKFEHVEEVGVTRGLLEVYLRACRSYKLNGAAEGLSAANLHPSSFVESFCNRMERDLAEKEEPLSTFWQESLTDQWGPYSQTATPPAVVGESELIVPTLEDHLIQLLMEDLHLEDNKKPSELIVPIDQSLRDRLEHICLKRFMTECESLPACSAQHSRHKKQSKLEKGAHVIRRRTLVACQHLYTKVLICNAIAGLVSASFSASSRLVVLLLTTRPMTVDCDDTDVTSISPVDPIFGSEFLLDCLLCLLKVLRDHHTDWARNRSLFVYQFVTFLVQQGMAMFGDRTPRETSSDYEVLRRGFSRLMNILNSHELLNLLPPDCQSFVRSIALAFVSILDPLCKDDSVKDVEAARQPSEHFGLCGLAHELEAKARCTESTETIARRDNRWLDQSTSNEHPFNTSKDVDMRSLSIPAYESHLSLSLLYNSTPSGRLLSQSDDLWSDSSSLIPNCSSVHLLLTSRTPVDVNTSVRLLLQTMSANRILELNTAWLPALRRLFSLGLPSGPSGVVLEDSPIDLLLSNRDHNTATLCVILVQLAKASISLQLQQTPDFGHIRSLLLASLNGLASLTGPHLSGRSSESFKLLRAAIHHELLLHELLEVLNPVSDFGLYSFSDDTESSGVVQKSPARRFHFSELSRRAKSCLFQAAGLYSNASDLESKMSASFTPGLSTQLVSAASCFLLMNHEHYFLLPTAKQNKSATSGLPRGALPSRGMYLGPLELIRALLRLHRAATSLESHRTKTSNSVDEKNELQSASPQRSPASSLISSINNLWNLIIFGCLIPELASAEQKTHDGVSGSTMDPKNGRSQIQLTTLLLVAQSLAHSGQTVQCGLHSSTDSRWKITEGFSRKPPISLCLLNCLIACLTHVTRAVSPSICLPKLVRSAEEAASLNIVEETARQKSESTKLEADSEPEKPSEHRSARRKRSRWDPVSSGEPARAHTVDSIELGSGPSTDFLLFSNLWPKEIPLNSQLPSEVVCDLLLEVLITALTTQPDRLDWLLLRAELEFAREQYRYALLTYLEICALATNSFIRPIPSFICCEHFISRLVHTCRTLDLFAESVILCQLVPGGSLIGLGLQLIAKRLDSTLESTPSCAEPNGVSNENKPGVKPTQTTKRTVEKPRGACGGTLNAVTLDCLDNYIDYIWDVRLLETLSQNALAQGALVLHAKFNAHISIPELNSGNPLHVLSDSAQARSLEFLSLMADRYLT